MAKRDYYEVLGVDRKVSGAELKKVYRRLARKYHPDVNPGDKPAEARFKEISEAYHVLSDPEKKKKYDRLGHDAFGPGFDPFAGFRRGGGPGGFDFSGFGDIGDILGDFFGSARGESGRPRRAPQPGEDIRYAVELAFEDALRGMSANIVLNRRVRCETCKGRGVRAGRKRVACPQCGGSGQEGRARGFFSFGGTCRRCGGSGQINPDPCPGCGGSGMVSKSERLQVKIPPGVDTGSKVRLAGKGHQGSDGAPPGDLYILTKVGPHPYFERKGDNIYTELPITFREAALGARVKVQTVDGTASMTIPEGTQSSQKFRLQGKGVRRLKDGGRGDHFVTVQVIVPKGLDDRSKKLIREFEKSHPEDPRAKLKV